MGLLSNRGISEAARQGLAKSCVFKALKLINVNS